MSDKDKFPDGLHPPFLDEYLRTSPSKTDEFQSIGAYTGLGELTDPKLIDFATLEEGLEELIERRQLEADIMESFNHISLIDVINKFGGEADCHTIGELYARHIAELTSVQPIHKDVKKALNVTISDWMLENDFDYRK